MFTAFRHLIGWVINAFRPRQDLMLENLALRQQLLAVHAKRTWASALDPAEVVLGDLAAVLVGMGDSPGSCSTANGKCSGIERVFVSIGNGYPTPGSWAGESR